MATLPFSVLSARCCCRASLSSSSSTSSNQLVQSTNAFSSAPASTAGLSGRFVDSGVMISGAAYDDFVPVRRTDEQSEFCFAKACAKLGLIGLAAAAICYSAPALAYKGGGPYGMEVTRGQDLTGKDFSGKALINQDFKTSILRQCNFRGAKLLGASFFDSDLTGADLTDADLRGADFSLANALKANFTNATFEGATVTGNTSFKGAIITGAGACSYSIFIGQPTTKSDLFQSLSGFPNNTSTLKWLTDYSYDDSELPLFSAKFSYTLLLHIVVDFTDVLWRDDQRVDLCKVADGVNPVTGNATRETLLCD